MDKSWLSPSLWPLLTTQLPSFYNMLWSPVTWDPSPRARHPARQGPTLLRSLPAETLLHPSGRRFSQASWQGPELHHKGMVAVGRRPLSPPDEVELAWKCWRTSNKEFRGGRRGFKRNIGGTVRLSHMTSHLLIQGAEEVT